MICHDERSEAFGFRLFHHEEGVSPTRDLFLPHHQDFPDVVPRKEEFQ